MAWYRRWHLVSGIALLAMTNAVVLGGVMYNRSGEPESTLTLSERELLVPYSYRRSDENTGLALRLTGTVESTEPRENAVVRLAWHNDEPAWLTAHSGHGGQWIR